MAHSSKFVFKAVWTIIFLLGVYIIWFGIKNFSKDIFTDVSYNIQDSIIQESVEFTSDLTFPIMDIAQKGDSTEYFMSDSLVSLYGYIHPYSGGIFSNNNSDNNDVAHTDSMKKAMDVVAKSIQSDLDNNKNTVSDSIEGAVLKENEEALLAASAQVQSQEAVTVDEVKEKGIDVNKEVKGTVYDENMLTFDFLMNNFYTVDSTTNVTQEQLNASELLKMDMSLKTSSDKPQILIYHTHSQEGFVDSKEGDSSTTVVGVGEYLTKLLKEKYGFNVIHDTSSYDLIDGKIDRNEAYSLASENISKILKENPSIEVVIDLHRDGIEGEKLVTDIDGKKAAKIMFFNGLSYTNKNGQIAYLKNPYIKENLSFSLKLQVEAAKYYPGLTRKIYLKGYRYNLHLKEKSLLVEVGAQNNTVEEEMNAMEPLADILARVLSKSDT